MAARHRVGQANDALAQPSVDYLGSTTQGAEASRFYDRDPVTDEEKIAFVEERASVYNYYLHALHRAWYEAVLWYVGEHYLEAVYDRSGRGRFGVRPVPAYVPRSTTNHIYPKVEVGVQLFLDSFPDAVVKPSTREHADRLAAEAASHVRRHLWSENVMDVKMRETGVWTVTTGNSYMLNYLDHANKERVRVPVIETVREPVADEATGEPVLEPDPLTGQMVPAFSERRVQTRDPETGEELFEEVVLADVNTNVITPFELVPDFGARFPWEMRRYVHFRAYDLDYLRSQFGAEATKDLKAENSIPLNSYYQFKIIDLIARSEGSRTLGAHVGVSGADAAEWLFMRNSAILKTYFEIPDDRHPRGRIYAVANGQLLYDGPYDDLYGEKLNLYQFTWSRVPGSLFGMGMVKNLIDPQRRLNGLDTQRALIRKTMGNPAWLVPVGSKFNAEIGEARPGKIYTWKKNPTGRPPDRLDPKQPPFDMELERRNILKDMEEISGIRHVLSGESPPGVTAGVSLDILTEAAGKRFVPHVRENRETFRRMEKGRLSIAQKAPAWALPRLVHVLGEDAEYEARKFQATDFTGEYDVHVEAVVPSLFSDSQRKADVVQGINLNLIDLSSVDNREMARQDLGIGRYKEPVSADMKVALYENERLLAGTPVELGPYDDHSAHVPIHMKIFKRTDVEDLDPRAVQAAMQHLEAHLGLYRQQVEEEQRAQARLAEAERGAGKKPQEAAGAGPPG